MVSPPSALETTIVEIERHVAQSGWDRPPVLFALVDTAELVSQEPALAETWGLSEAAAVPGALTPIEQEPLEEGPLDEVLAGITWPAEVLGCAIVQEVLVLPPSAEAERPSEENAADWAAGHPDRREVRMGVAVLRDGSRASALRVRAEGADPTALDDVLVGPDLAPNLADALMDTLR
ncbi:MAG: PPA1309 family protein [Actinomycetota bacterium]|nr:PPA1309 family protein [Actinomycetota bacterium]